MPHNIFSKHIFVQNVAFIHSWSSRNPYRSKFSGVLNTMAKGWKLQHSPFLRYPTTFSQNIFLLRKWFSFVPRAPETLKESFQGCCTEWQRVESSNTHHFWDIPHHFLKTHVCLESGFILFIELQKSLKVSFQGCWTQRLRFESSNIHHFWDTQQHFLKTHFCL